MDRKAGSSGVVEFSLDAWIRVFIREDDLKFTPEFDQIIQSDKDLAEKEQLVEELIVKLANEKLQEASIEAEKTYGVKIDVDSLGSDQIAEHYINVLDLVEEETKDWGEMKEYKETKNSSVEKKEAIELHDFHKVEENCPNCGSAMSMGASHQDTGGLQWECHNCGYVREAAAEKKADFTNNNQDLSNWFNETKPPSESIERLIDPPKTATDEEEEGWGDPNYPRKCPCGSGKEPWQLDDARGISVGLVCEDCEAKVKRRYRPEIFEDPSYEVDEQIEPDASVWTSEPRGERYLEPIGSQEEEE